MFGGKRSHYGSDKNVYSRPEDSEEAGERWSTKHQKDMPMEGAGFTHCATCGHKLKIGEYAVCKGCLDKATNGHPVPAEKKDKYIRTQSSKIGVHTHRQVGEY